MKIIEFENKQDKEAIKAVMKEVQTAKNFIFIFSDDDLSTVHHIDMNLSNVEKIGVLDCVKHKILHNVLPDDDDSEPEEIPAEGGLR